MPERFTADDEDDYGDSIFQRNLAFLIEVSRNGADYDKKFGTMRNPEIVVQGAWVTCGKAFWLNPKK